jgi:uncharacterized protein (DUF58 family)
VLKPSRTLLAVVLGWLALGAPTWLVERLAPGQVAWLGLGLVVLIGLLIDALRVWRENPGIDIERHLPERWPVNAPVNVRSDVQHAGRRPIRVLIHDLLPATVRSRRLPIDRRLRPGERHEVHWQARALRRGPMTLAGIHLAWLSPWRLWWRRVTLRQQARVRVYPNFNLVIQYGQLAGDRRLEEMGIHLQPRRGAGSDFHQLRDYREGDSLRQIDWHATSRVRKLIAKDYQEERDQRVVFLLDCSRRMRAMDGEISHFDQCLNALLLLAHVALRQGDEVALQTLAAGDGRERLLPPGRGQRQFGSLLEAVYDLDAGLSHPDYLRACADLMRHQRRRSLVVVLTNLRDEDHGELDPALALLRQRHLVVLADLRECLGELEGLPASRPPRTMDDALLMAGQSLYRRRRRAATRQLSQMGIIYLDILPQHLASALVSQYRRLKASGTL